MKHQDDDKTMVGIRIGRDKANTLRQVVQLGFVLIVFTLLIGTIGVIQYASCLRDDPEISFLECVRTWKVKKPQPSN